MQAVAAATLVKEPLFDVQMVPPVVRPEITFSIVSTYWTPKMPTGIVTVPAPAPAPVETLIQA